MRFLLLLILLRNRLVNTGFSPNRADYDAYGLKIAANDGLFVQADGDEQIFLIQFAPYNYTLGSLQCSIDYDDSTHYVYSVGVGIKQNTTTNPYFYFAGEIPDGWSSTDSSGNNGTFIGVWINLDPQTVQQYISTRQTFSCDYFKAQRLQFLTSYKHQEFYVIAVEPYGQYAIGLATDFVFIYRLYPTSSMTTKASTAVWPNNSTFNPCAADASQTFTIVAGFVHGSPGSEIRATPTVYSMSNTNLTVLSVWSYNATDGSWQSHLTYFGADFWSRKFTMSVKVNSDDPTRVLVGMPFLNTVFLFVVGNNGASLTLASYIDNGESVGYGKSVTWLTSSQSAILVSKYSLDYLTWYSSKVYLYTALNTAILPSSPTVIIPNTQQTIPSTISTMLIRAISTPASLAVLDDNGGVIIILAESPGYYASTDTTKSQIAAAMPVVSYSTICMAGTYKSDTGVQPCTLCPSGTRNPGVVAAISCTNCSPTSFCPLGAVYDIDSTLLNTVSQRYAYPRTPELNVFEDLLLHNMFSLGSTPHCIVVSPIFWTLIVLSLVFGLLIGMASLNGCVQQPRRDRWRANIKSIFQSTDLVGEGELWVGGLASLVIILMTAMAYAFAISYLNQYPAEKVGPSTFACDVTIRNAQFESSLESLVVPISDESAPIFDLLNNQNFTLQLDFINTVATCKKLSIVQATESLTKTLKLLSCSNANGILSATVLLPQHDMTIKATVADIQLIGGVRLGLSGPNQENGSYKLKTLNFLESFSSESIHTLVQKASIDMALTKVVNETEPLSSGNSDFEGIWYPTFTYSLSEMFITADDYALLANLTSTTLTIDISETSYYIKNVQSPIAKEPEVIFRTLLFAFLCLELSAMTFLIIKLVLIPLCNKITRAWCCHHKVEPIETVTKHCH